MIEFEIGDVVKGYAPSGFVSLFRISRVEHGLGFVDYKLNGKPYFKPHTFMVHFNSVTWYPYENNPIRYALFRNGIEVKE